MLLRQQYSQNWSPDSMHYVSKSSWFLCRNLQVDHKINMEIQGTQIIKNNPEKKKQQIWRTHTFWFQNLLSRYSDGHCGTGIKIGLRISEKELRVRKQMLKCMASWFSTRITTQFNEKSFQQMVLGQLNIYM